MFIGHFAVGFGSKRWAPRTPLTVLILAAIFLDVLWPIFLALGWESVRIVPSANPFLRLDFVSYPISHSLVTSIGWSILFAWLVRSRDRRGAVVAGIGVFSHWVLDFVTHRPDLPIAPGLPIKVGLGLWNSPALTVIIESLMFVVALALYLRVTRARGIWGHLSLWTFVALLGLAYAADVLGPAPPDVKTLVIISLVSILLMAWVVWIDRTREVRAG